MSIDESSLSGTTATPDAGANPGFWTGRSALIIPAFLVGVAAFLIYGMADMDLRGNDELFGPRAFPAITAAVCVAVAALLTLSIVRHREIPEFMVGEDGRLRPGTASNWPAVATALGSLVLFVLLLPTAGWIIAGAAVFWGLTVALGNRRYVFNLLVGLAMASIMQIVFSGLLGLSLPPGLLGGF